MPKGESVGSPDLDTHGNEISQERISEQELVDMFFLPDGGDPHGQADHKRVWYASQSSNSKTDLGWMQTMVSHEGCALYR